MKHLLVLLGILIGAAACYAVGFGVGVTAFWIAGALLELTFWILALTSPPPCVGDTLPETTSKVR